MSRWRSAPPESRATSPRRRSSVSASCFGINSTDGGSNVMPKHIGIVACSAEGAALCYRTVCVEGERLLGTYAHPEVSMHTHSFADYMERVELNDWPGVGELMLSSAAKLAA